MKSMTGRTVYRDLRCTVAEHNEIILGVELVFRRIVTIAGCMVRLCTRNYTRCDDS